MPEPGWVTYKETTHGVNSDGYADIFNRVERTLWTVNFLAEHNKDGTHKAALLTGVWEIETGTYTGTGAGTTQVVSLVNTSNTVQFFRGLSADVAYTFFASGTNQEVYETDGSDTGEVVVIATGNITVTGELNVLNRVYHYAVYTCYVGGGPS